MNLATVAYVNAHRDDTAAEVAEALAIDPRFSRRIDRTPLRALFAGTLIGVKIRDAANSDATPLELRYGLQRVLMVVGWEDGYLDTVDPATATELRSGIAALVQLGVLTSEEAAQLLDLGGGPFLDPLTADEVKAIWAEQSERDALAALRATAGTAYNAVVALLDGGERNPAALAAAFANVLEG